MNFDSFVLTAATADLRDEPAARDDADLVEYRLDLGEATLDALSEYTGELPVLVTNRPTWEGGEAADTPDRLDTLEIAATYDHVTALDIELATLEAGDGTAVLDRAAAEAVSVVVSTHDFEQTPSKDDLRDLLTRASEYGDVAKLAVTAQDRGDVLDLLSVTHELTEAGETVATMAMGEAGRHSRAVAPLYGSKIGYAPVDPADATAPGQYDLRTLRSLVDKLKSE